MPQFVPSVLGNPFPWVYASGAAEMSCALTLLPGRTRRAAGWASAALFVAVLPANVNTGDLKDGHRGRMIRRSPIRTPRAGASVSGTADQLRADTGPALVPPVGTPQTIRWGPWLVRGRGPGDPPPGDPLWVNVSQHDRSAADHRWGGVPR